MGCDDRSAAAWDDEQRKKLEKQVEWNGLGCRWLCKISAGHSARPPPLLRMSLTIRELGVTSCRNTLEWRLSSDAAAMPC